MTSLIITMAGYGKRLESYARGVPKPYLNLAGKPSFIWALSSFDLSCFSKITFITSRSIFEFQDPILILKQTMRTEIDAECVILESVPNGQALSLREGLLRSDVPTSFCVFNCDTALAMGLVQSPAICWRRSMTDGYHGVVAASRCQYQSGVW